MHRYNKSAVAGNSKKSRKIMIIKPSKYEATEAIQSNKKYWGNVFDQLDTPAKGKEPLQNQDAESAYLAEILPEKLYRKVCNTLDLPMNKNIGNEEIEESFEEERFSRIVKEPVLYLRKTIRIDRDINSDTEVEVSPRYNKSAVAGNSKKSRKIMIIKPSKYEATEAIQSNKKYWGNVFDQLDTPAKGKEPLQNQDAESAYLAEILPEKLYRKVCNTLDLPMNKNIGNEEIEESFEEERFSRIVKEPVLYLRKTIRIDRDINSDTEVEVSPRDAQDDVNVHWELLKKPEREQVTWPTHYLQPELEEEKTLVRKADDLTDRIVHDFCEYMTQLGGNQQSQLFKPKAIKELFQIEFDTHVARSLQVIPKELPSIEEKIAEVTGNPELSQYAVLEREVTRDIKAEHRPDILGAFSRSLPHREQRRAPHNHTKSMWRSARHVPKDLVSLKTVWEGITNLRSVKEYCRWMIDHPEYKRAPYLSSLGMFDSAVLEARLTLESLQRMASPTVAITSPGSNAPAPIEHIRRRLSQLADTD